MTKKQAKQSIRYPKWPNFWDGTPKYEPIILSIQISFEMTVRFGIGRILVLEE